MTAKGKAPAFQFYVRDWLSDPQLKMASLSSRGMWIDLLCFMWEAPERGKITGSENEIARLLGIQTEEVEAFIEEAKILEFATVTECDGRMLIPLKAATDSGEIRPPNPVKAATLLVVATLVFSL